MLSAVQREHMGKLVRPMQVIVCALAFGVLVFMAVAIAVKPGAPAGQEREPFLAYIAIVFTFAILAAWFIVPRTMVARLRKSMAGGQIAEHMQARAAATLTEEQRQIQPFIATYSTKLIVACALLEGAAFFNVVIYFLERQPFNLLIALALVLMILAHFPTTSCVTSWIEDETSEIDRLRSMRGR
jgi:hypothetical protein